METCDAVVIGAGHNGLVAANLLADAGWDVLVVEGAPQAGGAVRTAAVTAPGFVSDLYSSFFPMTAASPVISALRLEDHGLEWSHAPTVLSHLREGAPAAVLHRDAASTADGLEADCRGDGEAWMELARQWDRYGEALLHAMLVPFPPVRAGVRLAVAARADVGELAWRTVVPVRGLAERSFRGELAPLLLAGNALHADVSPEAAPSGLLGWMLTSLAQTVGYPVPVGGAGRIVDALLVRLEAAGGRVRTGCAVERVIVRGGRAVGVDTVDGPVEARHAVLAACDAQVLYGRLVDERELPDRFLGAMQRFERASGTVKVDYALDEPVPWKDPSAVGAGTVHIADSLDELTRMSSDLATGRVPAEPFLLIGQTTTADPTRSPEGTESMWVYTHVPQVIRCDAGGKIDVEGRLRGPALDAFVERIEARIERHAPGFASRIVARHVQGPDDMEAANPSLVGGDIAGGTAQLHQQLVFRPVPGLGRAETPITGLYLASSSAHPGGSVHGACGANAARAAMVGRRAAFLPGRRVGGLAAGAALLAAGAATVTARRHGASGRG